MVVGVLSTSLYHVESQIGWEGGQLPCALAYLCETLSDERQGCVMS